MVQPLIRIDQNCLRRVKALSRLQLPGKGLRIDSCRHPQRVMGIHLRLDAEIAAVDQRKPDNLSLTLIRMGTAKHQERIVLMGGIASHASDCLDSRLQLPAVHMALSGPAAGKLLPYIIPVRQVQTKTHGPGKAHGLPAFIYKACAPCENASLGKNRVEKLHPYPRQGIFQSNCQGFGLIILFRIGSRKSGKLRLSRLRPIALILKIRKPASVLLAHLHRRLTEIRGAEYGIFLADMLQGKGVVVLKDTGRHRPLACLQKIGEILPVPNPLSIVKLTQMTVF